MNICEKKILNKKHKVKDEDGGESNESNKSDEEDEESDEDEDIEELEEEVDLFHKKKKLNLSSNSLRPISTTPGAI
jgi:hypothetical protein